MKQILLIGGATAVGKSDFALKLSQKINMEIISADSVQVYKQLNLATSKPTKEETKICPHHLIDIADINEKYNAYNFVCDAKQKIDEISKKGKLPVIVGGTGLYMECLLYDYSFDKLSKDKKQCLYNYRLIVLNQNREALYNKINLRVDKMIENGLVDEVKNLIKSGITAENQCMQAIGYKEIFNYINGEISLNDAILKFKQRTRNYAKRQITWFKHMEKAEWVDVDTQLNQKLEEIVNFYKFYSKNT